MSDYPTYPCYVGSVSYTRELMSYDLSHGGVNPSRVEGLPPYRIRDHTQFFEWMYLVDPGEEAVRERTVDAWNNMVEHPDKQRSPEFVARNPDNVEFKVERLEDEEWHLTWFCHETPDIGQSDAEVLESFHRFLDRKGVIMGDHTYDSDKYNAMGAEDYYRWRGEGDEDKPPCRCEGCKKSGMIRINH